EAAFRFSLQERTKLSLPARTAEKDYHKARNQPRNFPAQIFLDHRQCQIDARSYPARSIDIAIADIDKIGFDPERGVCGGEMFAICPMRCNTAVVQQTCGGKKVRTSTNGRHAPALRRHHFHPLDQSWLLACPRGTNSAGDDQSIEVINHLVQAMGCRDLNTAHSRYRPR